MHRLAGYFVAPSRSCSDRTIHPLGAGKIHHGVRRRVDEERARRRQRRLHREDRRQDRRPAMPRAPRWRGRSNRARRPTSSFPPTSNGWTTPIAEEDHQRADAGQPARQQAGADRAEGFQDRQRRASARASISPGSPATAGSPPATCKSVPVGKYAKAALEKLGSWKAAETEIRDGRKRARGADAGRARRGAARHRLRDRRQGRAGREDRRRFPGRTRIPAIIYPVAATANAQAGRRGVSRVPAVVERPRRSSRSTASPSSIKPVS